MAIRYNDEEKRLSLSVRDVLLRAEPRGDLRLAAVSSSARLAMGRAVHADEQAARLDEESTYDAEVSVQFSLVAAGWECTVKGRIDGLMVSESATLVEEIKSTLLPSEVVESRSAADWPEWSGQVALYVWLLESTGRGPANGQLVIVSLADGARVILPVPVDLGEIEALVVARLESLVEEREAWLAWRNTRANSGVPFAHERFRRGQESVAQEVYEAIEQSKQLLLSAPTGTGKTAAVLQGALKAAARRGLRVFFATAKGTQREMVERTLEQMVERELPIRAVSLTAREKLCLNDTVDCRAEACRFAEGHFDRLSESDALRSSWTRSVLSTNSVRQIGETRRLCPHALGGDLAAAADVVVGDYNYVFDPRMNASWFSHGTEDWVVIVDEAHNLVERARSYGSPRLSARLAYEAEYWLADQIGEGSAIHGAFCNRLARAIEDSWVDPDLEKEGEWETDLQEREFLDLMREAEELGIHYALLAGQRRSPEDPYFELLQSFQRFMNVLRSSGEETLRIYGHSEEEGSWLRLLCLDPSVFLRKRLDALFGLVLMSATLRPAQYHQDLLGLDPERVRIAEFDSGFPSENRGVYLATRVSTAWRDRAKHRERTGELLRRIVEASPGHTAIYYSSYGMLESLAPLCEQEQVRDLLQSSEMSESEREEVRHQLETTEEKVVLHAVLGGVFSEGVDLPQGCLKTVVVVGPGLPAVGVERERIRDWCEERYGEGFQYGFLVPGLSKVIQAAGRVVRSSEDRGAVVLVGRRFGWREYRDLLPPEWVVNRVEDPAESVRQFWASGDESDLLG